MAYIYAHFVDSITRERLNQFAAAAVIQIIFFILQKRFALSVKN